MKESTMVLIDQENKAKARVAIKAVVGVQASRRCCSRIS
jgi:hypothetical protein